MVGEIRDPETAQIAIQSALRAPGFTTVHANNVVDVLGRFLNMGVEPYQFVSALNCVPRPGAEYLHPLQAASVDHARDAGESALDPALLRSQVFTKARAASSAPATGYKSRTAICELLDLSDPIREMILERRPTEIKKAAREEGMQFLRESAVEKVVGGTTTLREINKVTFVE